MYRILIWGTGAVAGEVLRNKLNAEVAGFIQTKKTMDRYLGHPVYDAAEIPQTYDYILVANSYANEIFDTCQKRDLPLDKVIFLAGVKRQEGLSDLDVIKEILGEKNYTNYCAEFGLLEHTFLMDDIQKYRELNTRPSFEIQDTYMWPVIRDKHAMAGAIGNYFFQDLWAARLIIRSGAKEHFDIGSRMDGFIAHLLAADIHVTMIDVREFPGRVEHLHTIVDDAAGLRQLPDESVESMSALCSIEHFGLGRYGDPINPEACFQCFSNIQKKLKKGGRLYLSVPVGKERVEFNAHRIFYASTIKESLGQLSLKEFSCAAENKLEYHVDIHKYDHDLHNGEYRYGLFYFVKEPERCLQ